MGAGPCAPRESSQLLETMTALATCRPLAGPGQQAHRPACGRREALPRPDSGFQISRCQTPFPPVLGQDPWKQTLR